jgi:hypothetical protein
MSTGLHMMSSHFEVGINAVADAFAGTVTSDIVSMKHHNRVKFIAHWGVGTTGTVTFTVEACDDVSASNTSAIAYYYRVTTAAAAPGAVTAATSSGFTTTAGSNQVIEIEVPAENLAASGYSYVRLKGVEVANDPLLGGILIQMLEPRFPAATQPSSVT